MFHLRRTDAPPQSRQSEKPASRRSSSSRTPSSSSSTSSANIPLLPRRAPLAPLDPQSTNALAIDDQMSPSPSSSSFLGYNPADSSQDSDPARFNIGRPIIPRNAPDDYPGNLPSTSRRRSIPNQYVRLSPPTRIYSYIPFLFQTTNKHLALSFSYPSPPPAPPTCRSYSFLVHHIFPSSLASHYPPSNDG